MPNKWWETAAGPGPAATTNGLAYALHVSTYGAVGDGVTDDATAIQAGIAAAALAKQPLLFDAGKTYLVKSELTITSPVSLCATVANMGNGQYATIKAGPASAWTPGGGGMKSVFKVMTDGCYFSGIMADSNNMTKYCWFVGRSSFGHWEQCGAYNGLIDGFHLARYQNETGLPFAFNDTNHFEDCWAVNNGRLWMSNATALEGFKTQVVGGTVSTTSGSDVITFAGTDFATLAAWLRFGDFICISTGSGDFPATGAMYLRIDDVAIVPGSNQITVGHRFIPDQTLSGKKFMIGQGAGYWSCDFGDNNVNRISGGLWRGNGGAGIHASGLVGPHIENVQSDFNAFYGIAIGPGNVDQTFSTSLVHPYLESNLVSHLLYSGAYGINVISPEWGAGAQRNTLSHGAYGIAMPGSTENMSAIGSTASDVPSTKGSAFRNTGTVSQYVGGVSTQVAAQTIAYDNATLQLATSADVAYTSTPTLAAGVNYGDMCTLFNASAGNYTTVDDYRKRAGTTLRLKTPSVALGPGDSLTLMWDQTYWTELKRSVAAVAGSSTGSPGSATINQTQGRSAIAAGASTVTITNSMVVSGDVVMLTLEDLDATAIRLKVVTNNGNFVVTANANATATTKFSWLVVKQG